MSSEGLAFVSTSWWSPWLRVRRCGSVVAKLVHTEFVSAGVVRSAVIGVAVVRAGVVESGFVGVVVVGMGVIGRTGVCLEVVTDPVAKVFRTEVLRVGVIEAEVAEGSVATTGIVRAAVVTAAVFRVEVIMEIDSSKRVFEYMHMMFEYGLAVPEVST